MLPNTNQEKELRKPPPPPPPASAYARADELARLAERVAALEKKGGEIALPAHSDQLDAVIAQWEKHAFARLDFTCEAKLQTLIETYGAAEVIAAMDEAAQANKATGRYGAVSYNFFAEVLKRRMKPKPEPKKGARRNERDDSLGEHTARGNAAGQYRAPRRAGNEPWRRETDAGRNGRELDSVA